MSQRDSRVQRLLRWGSLGLAVLVTVTAVSSEADARTRRKAKPSRPAVQAYNPPTASIVVDANTGATLHASNADATRHPASLTKMMTLYMLFERLDSGKVKLNGDMPVSSHAAAQAPSKLGIRPGETIKVETAIKALVTKSANDVAVIIAEYLGGDEPTFARMMTAKARSLGMLRTTYRNASGLPDVEQITTARDQALLGRALQDRFPNYFGYFSARSFTFNGRTVRGHNRLLGTVDGVDGIKTGYIRASGFNIVTSVNRNDRKIVAAVFGGRTAGARDAVVRSLIAGNIQLASTKRTAPPVAEGTAMAEIKMPAKPPLPDPKPEAVAAAPANDGPEPGSTDPIKPVAVKTVLVQPGATRMAALSELPTGSRKLQPSPAQGTAAVTTISTVKSDLPPPPPGAAPGVLGVLSAKSASGTQLASVSGKVALPPAPPAAAPETVATAKPRNAAGGWMIQVGAFPEEKSAKERLSTVQGMAKELGDANPFTEKVAKGDHALYRARFAGLDKTQAETACKNLKRSEIPCMLLRH